MNLKHIDKICLIGCLLGLSIVWVYLSLIRLNITVPFETLAFGVLLCSFTLTISYLKATQNHISVYSLIILYLIAYGMLILYSFRYDVFGGPDTIGEYVIASKTYQLGKWPIDSLSVGWGDRAGRYASCLSVTILPAIMSSVSSISMLSIFKFILPAIGAFEPILVYLIAYELLKNKKLAFLCGAFFAVSHLQIFLLSYLFREQIAGFFILLGLYALVKFQTKENLAIVLFLGVMFSNAGHATADFSFLLLIAFIVVPIFFMIRRKRKELLPWKLIIIYLVASFLWLFFVVNQLYSQHITIITDVFSNFIQYFPEYLARIAAGGGLFPKNSLVGAAAALPISVFLKYWYYLNIALALLGLLVAIAAFRKDPRKLSVITYCFFLSSVFVFAVFAPGFIPDLTADRVFADSMFSILIGILLSTPYLLKRPRFLKNFRLLDRINSRKVVSVFGIFTVIFLFVSLPMNLNLIDHSRILHYHSENTLDPSIRAAYFDVSFSEFNMAGWVEKNIPSSSWITVDQRGFDVAYLSDHINKTYQSSPIYSDQSDFMILSSFYMENGIWIVPENPSAYPSQNITWQSVASNSSIIYNDGGMVMTLRVPE